MILQLNQNPAAIKEGEIKEVIFLSPMMFYINSHIWNPSSYLRSHKWSGSIICHHIINLTLTLLPSKLFLAHEIQNF